MRAKERTKEQFIKEIKFLRRRITKLEKSKSERKKVEKKLREGEEQYKILVQTIPDIIYEIDTEGRFIFVSDGIKELGYNPEELVGKHFREIMHPDDFEAAKRAIVLPKYKGKVTGDAGAPKLFDERRTVIRMTRNLEVRLVLKGQKDHSTNYRYTEMSSSGNWDRPVQNKNKKFLGSIGIIRNITERKNAEEELKKARDELEAQAWGLKKTNEAVRLLYKELEEKTKKLQELDQLKSDFISTVSHELRTPLSITKEGISLVLDRIPGEINERQEKVLTAAKGNIDRLARIINDLLDISKIEAGKATLKRELIDIRGLAKQVAASLTPQIKKKDLELKVSLPEEGIDVYIDADKITQVFTNLISNALKFTEKGYIEISAQEKEDEVECAVADTGRGISPENLPKVFSKFQQFGRVAGPGVKGTGLGLSIAKGIVEMHKGRIWLESELGQGTKFLFTLPKYTAEVLFKEYLDNGIKEAIEKEAKLSFIVISIAELNKLKQGFSDGEIQSILKDMEGVLKSSLRREGDAALQVSNEIIVLLTNCDKKNSLRVQDRLKQTLEDHLVHQNLAEKVKLRFGCLTYPDEVKNAEGLIEKLKKD